MAEFKLSYTAQEINEKLGKIDNLMFSEVDIISYTILPQTEYDEVTYFGLWGTGIMPAPAALKLGQTYIVEWDGTSYECPAQDVSQVLDGIVALGNGSAFGYFGNEEPFIIGVAEDLSGVMCLSLTDTTPTTHTVRIYQKQAFIPKVSALDNNKFLRVVDGVPTWVTLTDVSQEGA